MKKHHQKSARRGRTAYRTLSMVREKRIAKTERAKYAQQRKPKKPR